MSCCGNKKDVAQGTTKHGLKASKFYGTDNTLVTAPITTGYKPIPKNSAGSYSKVTKQEDYAIENTTGSKSRLYGNDDSLNFQLDHQPGVANTFDIPTFDYQTMLNHNIYFNLNSKGPLDINDGNKSVLRQSGTTGPKPTTVK